MVRIKAKSKRERRTKHAQVKVIEMSNPINDPPRIGSCMGGWWVVEAHVVASDNLYRQKEQTTTTNNENSSESKRDDNE